MSASIPSTHRALVATADKGFEVREKPLPTVRDGEVLVNVKAVTLNPTDWKHVQWGLLSDGTSTGSDFAGVVVKPAGNWKVGDRVAGFTRGGFLDKDNGAFGEYIKSPSELLWKVPESTSFEEAAAMGGIGSSTAIYDLSKLGVPLWTNPSTEPIPFLIWSGATSVGHYLVQLAKLHNLQAYVTASPKWHESLKALGAHEVFDYKDPDVAEKIKKASGGKIKLGLDTISEHGSPTLAAKAFSDEGGHLGLLLPYKKNDQDREDVEYETLMIYNAIDGKEPDQTKVLAQWNAALPDLITSGKFKTNPITKKGRGLESIPEGLEYLKSGKASGEKLAYTL